MQSDVTSEATVVQYIQGWYNTNIDMDGLLLFIINHIQYRKPTIHLIDVSKFQDTLSCP